MGYLSFKDNFDYWGFSLHVLTLESNFPQEDETSRCRAGQGVVVQTLKSFPKTKDNIEKSKFLCHFLSHPQQFGKGGGSL